MYSIGSFEVAEKLTCVKCGAPIERRAGPGRPPIYCGAACRASAAYEIRRIQRRLESLETFIGVLRRSEMNTGWVVDASVVKRREKERDRKVEAMQGEIAEAEERLRLLLSEPRGKTLEPKP